jgi:hypothetical protein
MLLLLGTVLLHFVLCAERKKTILLAVHKVTALSLTVMSERVFSVRSFGGAGTSGWDKATLTSFAFFSTVKRPLRHKCGHYGHIYDQRPVRQHMVDI